MDNKLFPKEGEIWLVKVELKMELEEEGIEWEKIIKPDKSKEAISTLSKSKWRREDNRKKRNNWDEKIEEVENLNESLKEVMDRERKMLKEKLEETEKRLKGAEEAHSALIDASSHFHGEQKKEILGDLHKIISKISSQLESSGKNEIRQLVLCSACQEQKNWTDIHLSFVPELQNQWQNLNFTHSQVQDW
jgi:hypothetical protein